MREVELKSVVDDFEASRRNVEAAGGVLKFEGELLDLRYADPDGLMELQDTVVRLRVYVRDGVREGSLDWKGPTSYEDGYKVREEVSTSVGDPNALARILTGMGLRVVLAIDRVIAQYEVEGAIVRFEKYPLMDDLVEVEGEPGAIERAIRATGLPREGFNSDRLPDFVARFEARTGGTAVLSRELEG
jgi:adenylate cyclase class IV